MAAVAAAASWFPQGSGSNMNGHGSGSGPRGMMRPQALTEALLTLLKDPDRTSRTQQHLPDLLDCYRQHGPDQGSSAVGGLVGFSNAKLSSSKTKFEGVCLLSVLIKDSSSELFQQHCVTWLRSLQQIIQSQAPVQTIQLAVSALGDLLCYAAQIAELCREVGLNSILGILTSLLGLKAECELAAMEGMTACMTYFPKACGSLRDKLGAFFISKMNSTDHRIQEVACQCYGRLPSLGGEGGRAEGWTNQVHCLLASANGILAQLYQGSESEGTVQYSGPGVELPFPPLDDCDPLININLSHRYRAVCYALKYTLSLDPKAALRLPVRQVLNLLCRALNVTAKSMNSTGDGVFRLLMLPAVHTHTLEVLSALITAVHSAMVPYATVLQKLFSQTLSAWTPVPETTLGQQRAYCAVRVQVYQTMLLWVRVGGASAGVLQGSPAHSELLLGHLLGEITPSQDAVKLRPAPSEVPRSRPGPRSRKPLLLIDSGSALQKKGDLIANQDTCLHALKVLRHIVLTTGTLLKDDVHKRLQDVVVPLCVRLQQQLTNHSLTLDGPGVSGQYGSALPRRELYRLLLALVLVPSPRWPPPLTCAVSVLSQGRRDHNLKVSTFCTEALAVCNALLHPRTPSLCLSLPPLALKAPSSMGVPGAPLGPFPPARGPLALLGSLESHLSLTAPPAGLLLSHHQDPGASSAAAAAAQMEALPGDKKPVFVRYDKEEPEDVEISLDSDSDDSVVIVPPGMLSMMHPTQDDPAANNTAGGAPSSAAMPGGEAPSSSYAPGPLDGVVGTGGTVSLANELPPGAALLAAAATAATSSLVSLIPPLGSAGAQPPSGLGESAAPSTGPQLQQMLMQSSSSSPGGVAAAGPPGPPGGGPMAAMALGPLQMHPQTLHSQLSQTSGGRQLHPPHAPPPPASSNEDTGVININSSDEEEEEEDMEEEEDELGEEEEDEDEEGLEDEDEEEEGSDFPEEDEEEYYEGEEYDYEDEEEEEEEGEIPSLESSRRRPGPRLDEGEGHSRRPGPRLDEGEGHSRRPGPRLSEEEGHSRRPGPRLSEEEGHSRRPGPRFDEGEGPRRRPGPRLDEGEGVGRRPGPRLDEGEGVGRRPGPRLDEGEGVGRRPGPRLEEGEVLGVEEGGAFGSDSGEAGLVVAGGIQEIPPPASRPPFGDEDGVRVTEVESIGVLEEAGQREEELGAEEDSDPSMPQILCVTGADMEEQHGGAAPEEHRGEAAVEEHRGGQEEEPAGAWAQAGGDQEAKGEGGGGNKEETDAHMEQEEPEVAVEPEVEAVSPAPEEGGATEGTPPADPTSDPPGPSHTDGSEQQHKAAKETEEGEVTADDQQEAQKSSAASGEQQPEEEKSAAGGGGDDNKGLKRKREESTEKEEGEEGQGTEKKRMDDEAMASMLADFIACPPDDEDGGGGASGSKA